VAPSATFTGRLSASSSCSSTASAGGCNAYVARVDPRGATQELEQAEDCLRRIHSMLAPVINQGTNDLGREPALARIAESEIGVHETHAFPRMKRNGSDILLSSPARMQA